MGGRKSSFLGHLRRFLISYLERVDTPYKCNHNHLIMYFAFYPAWGHSNKNWHIALEANNEAHALELLEYATKDEGLGVILEDKAGFKLTETQQLCTSPYSYRHTDIDIVTHEKPNYQTSEKDYTFESRSKEETQIYLEGKAGNIKSGKFRIYGIDKVKYFNPVFEPQYINSVKAPDYTIYMLKDIPVDWQKELSALSTP